MGEIIPPDPIVPEVVDKLPFPSSRLYPKSIKLKARMMYEVDSWTHKKIAQELGIPRWQTVSKWSTKDAWEKGSLQEIAEETELASRMALARRMGLGEKDQLAKAKELMDATCNISVEVPNGDGEIIEVGGNKPDYKIQNEGLKRAMELTGTKIERTETEHKYSGEIVHRYHLPEKKEIA